jgi:hypothetical protein
MNKERLHYCTRAFFVLSALIGAIRAQADEVITLPPIEIRASDGVYTIPVYIQIGTGTSSHVTFAHATTTGGTFVGINQTDPYLLDRIARTLACQQAVADYVAAKTQVMGGELQTRQTYWNNYQAEVVAMNGDIGAVVAKIYERFENPIAAQLCATAQTAFGQAVNNAQGGYIYLLQQAENTLHAGRMLNLSLWQGQANESCGGSQEFTTFTG